MKESRKEGTEGEQVSISATSHLISAGIIELLRTEEGHRVRGRVNGVLTGHLSPPLWLKHHEGIQFESAAHKEKEDVRVALRRALEFNPKVCDWTWSRLLSPSPRADRCRLIFWVPSFCIEKKRDAPTKVTCLDPQRLHVMWVNSELARLICQGFEIFPGRADCNTLPPFHSKPTLLRFMCKKGPGTPACRQTLRNRKVPVVTLCYHVTPVQRITLSQLIIAALSFQVEIQSEFPAHLHPSQNTQAAEYCCVMSRLFSYHLLTV